MTRFNIPARERLDLKTRLRKQLRNMGNLTTVVFLVITVFFPIAECFIVNKLTSIDESTAIHVQFSLWIAIIALGFIHFILALLASFAQSPLPEFLIEYSDLKDNLDSAEQQLDEQAKLSQMFRQSAKATSLSLLAIESMRIGKANLPEICQKVMAPG